MTTFKSLPFEVDVRFQTVPRRRDEPVMGLKDLIAAVKGSGSPQVRLLAMHRLLDTDYPLQEDILEAILADDNEPSHVRQAAAVCLGTVGSAGAIGMLARLATTKDPLVQAGVLRALVSVGDQMSLAALERAGIDQANPNAKMAAFASLMIHHRLNLQGKSMHWPRTGTSVRTGDQGCQRHVRTLPADVDEVELLFRSLGKRPLGVDISPSNAISLYCRRNAWILVFSRDAQGHAGTRALASQNRVLAIIAQRNSHLQRYATRFVVLSTPSGRDGCGLGVFGTNGIMLAAGSLRRGDGAEWSVSLSPVDGPKPFTLSVQGTLSAELAFTGEVRTGVGEKLKVNPRPDFVVPSAPGIRGETVFARGAS